MAIFSAHSCQASMLVFRNTPAVVMWMNVLRYAVTSLDQIKRLYGIMTGPNICFLCHSNNLLWSEIVSQTLIGWKKLYFLVYVKLRWIMVLQIFKEKRAAVQL